MSITSTFGLLAGSAVAAGALTVPALRRLALGSVSRDWLVDTMPYDRMDEDGIVWLKDSSGVRVYRIAGIPHQTMVIEEDQALHKARSRLLAYLGGLGLTVRIYAHKRQEKKNIKAQWPTQRLQLVGDAEAQYFSHIYVTDYHIMIQGTTARMLRQADQQVMMALGNYGVKRLMPAPRDELCPLTSFFTTLYSGAAGTSVVRVSDTMASNLPTMDIRFNRDSGLIEVFDSDGVWFHRVIGIHRWPESVSGQLWQQFLALPCALEITQIAQPVGTDTATALLVRKNREIASIGFGRDSTRIAENEGILDELGSGEVQIFKTQAQIILRSQSEQEINELGRQAMDILGQRRVSAMPEAQGAPVSWFLRQPVSTPLLRPLRLTNTAIASLWCWDRPSQGMERSPWSSGAVRLFSTPGGGSYQFQFHVSDQPQSKGHYLVFAPTGAGKTTLIMHLLSGLARLNQVYSYVFDSHEGARFMIEHMGGTYQSFSALALNPLDIAEDTQAARQRVTLILRAMLGSEGLSPKEEEEIAQAVTLAFSLDVETRTLDAIYGSGFSYAGSLRQRLAPWVTDEKGNKGLYAHVFNAGRDSMAGLLGQSFITGINMNEVLKDEQLGPPVVAHMAEAIRSAAEQENRKGFAIFIDEAANLLQNPQFGKFVQVMFREYRKLNGVVGLAFQDPGALTQSPLSESIIENAATMLFYPNPQGNTQAYEAFGLNDEEKRFIFEGSRQVDRGVLVVKRDAATGTSESVIIDANLSPLGAEVMAGYRSGIDAIRDLASAQTMEKSHD